MIKVSIICPVYNEEKHLKTCIHSLLKQDIDKSSIELIFVDGISKDKTREILRFYKDKYNFIKCFDNPKRVVPTAMNIGIRKAKGDIIIRIDAHSKYECNYISTLVSFLKKTGADNVGAVCKTDVLNKTPISLAIKEVLSHPFGVGNSKFRIGVDRVTKVDTVPFGCWRRDVFTRFGMYDERLVRNQDIELNKRIIRGGGEILLVPNTSCTYYARENIKPLLKNNFLNGFWNIKTVYLTREFNSLSLRHFVPLLFIISLILPVLGAIIYFPLIALSFCSLLLYSVVALYFSNKITQRKKDVTLFNLYRVFLSLHIGYGMGSLLALIKVPFFKR